VESDESGDVNYKCVICGKAVTGDGIIQVFLAPPHGSWAREHSTPYVFDVSPCCGARSCAEAAWEQARLSSIVEIESLDSTGEPDDEGRETPRRFPSKAEKSFVELKDETVVTKFTEWAVANDVDPHTLDSDRGVLINFLVASMGFSRREAEGAHDLFGLFENRDMREKIRDLRARVRAILERQDSEKAEGLVAECVTWAKELGLRSLRQADVEVFLSEKGVVLTRSAERTLWAKSSLQLRARR